MKSSFLMCAPTFFDVSYVINPWMEGNTNAVLPVEAQRQWANLRRAIASVANVELALPQNGLPDMVFTANAGVVLGNNAVLSRFLFPERQGEERHFEQWFVQHGFQVHKLPDDVPFEGAGDALLDRREPLLWMGTGHRSDIRAVPYVSAALKIAVQSLVLTDPRFYHLDTCFCPLEGGYLLYYPSAFDEASLSAIHAHVPPQLRIAVSEADALTFACNAVNVGKVIFLNRASKALWSKLVRLGFVVGTVPLGEFMKSGGAAKCLTLRLNEPRM